MGSGRSVPARTRRLGEPLLLTITCDADYVYRFQWSELRDLSRSASGTLSAAPIHGRHSFLLALHPRDLVLLRASRDHVELSAPLFPTVGAEQEGILWVPAEGKSGTYRLIERKATTPIDGISLSLNYDENYITRITVDHTGQFCWLAGQLIAYSSPFIDAASCVIVVTCDDSLLHVVVYRLNEDSELVMDRELKCRMVIDAKFWAHRQVGVVHRVNDDFVILLRDHILIANERGVTVRRAPGVTVLVPGTTPAIACDHRAITQALIKVLPVPALAVLVSEYVI